MKKKLLLVIITWFIIYNTQAQEFAGGSGTEIDPWQVETTEHFNNIRNYVGEEHNDKHFIQTADIDFEGMPLEPIGHESGDDYNTFNGVYNGNNYAIQNFNMIFPNDRHIGLFAYINSGEIRNLNIKHSFVEGYRSVGLIAGSAPYGHIVNCNTIKNQIKGDYSVGGIVGYAGILYNPNLFIKECASYENVIIGKSYIGGITGTARGTRIRNCYSTSSVTATEVISHPNMGTRSFCGGISGHNAWGGEIYDSYSVGPLSAADGNPAGISSYYSWYGALVSGCYWDTETSGTNYTYGSGAAGRNTDQMTYPFDANTFVNWDFETVWTEDEDGTINNGYPFHIEGYVNDSTFLLLYKTSEGGSINGSFSQVVSYGEDSKPVTAVAETGWVFVEWSDGVTTAERQDLNVTESLELIAEFKHKRYTAEAIYEDGPEMNTNRHNHHAVVLPNGNVALIGGRTTGFVSLNTAEILDTSTETFTTLTMEHIHDSPIFVKLNDGRYMIAGGSENTGVPSYDQTEIFDPTDLSFTSKDNMVRFRASGGGAALDDSLVIIASAWWTHNDAHTYGEIYDIEEDSFSSVGPFNISRSRGAVIPTNDGQALLLGGTRPTGNWENMPVESYDPETDEVSVIHDYIINENEIISFSSGQAITAYQQLANDSYLWMAQNRTGSETLYELITVNPETKEVSVFETMPKLPDSDEFIFLDHPIIDKENNFAYLIARVNNTKSNTIAVFTINLNTGALLQSSNFYNTEDYQLRSSPAVLLNDGRIFISGGSVSDNFDAVNKTLFVTPPMLTHDITTQVNNDDFGIVAGEGEYKHGEEVTLEAIPNEGYTLANWTEDNNEVYTESLFTFMALENRSITANFKEKIFPKYTLRINIEGKGNVNIDGTDYTTAMSIEERTVLSLEAIPDLNYDFVNWTDISGDEVSPYSDFMFTMPGDHFLLNAIFQKDNLSVEKITDGKIKVFPNPADNHIKVKSENIIERLILTASNGQVIKDKTMGKFNYKLNANNMQAGLYFIEIQTKEGVFTERVVIVR